VVIANDHYQSIGIVCLLVIRCVQRVVLKWSISSKLLSYTSISCAKVQNERRKKQAKPNKPQEPGKRLLNQSDGSVIVNKHNWYYNVLIFSVFILSAVTVSWRL